ncbi:mitochondrial import inner membrane translocase subunit Tim9 [Strongylocentrotus purpuratus]|uniref:Mitochondrial import inner membrane translocase subunit n=1 Tax=Strongylocentrotus purpuratus TaxID=7668 RepID=A0A7M7PSY9_STRPU|nr:mitochondrial import inner membrane translocase subunit Tim9 [Strongylocentrotus purpuratus]|eukprot:XP_792885.1 PREDICTED: mitochondrial import inner membrane translocase subunit Tim9 [Strongylocentrotus purpuratus]
MALQPQMDPKQLKDFLHSYNKLTEACFSDCVSDFTSRKLQDNEQRCSFNCMEKYLKMTQRVSMRFQEYQVQENEGLIAQQAKFGGR